MKKTHGKSKTKLYGVWKKIKSRCNSTSNSDYINYGARGISVQSDWINDFLKFESYILSLPSYDKDNVSNRGLTIDRIDNDGNYEEGNLQWSNKSMQARNQRMKKTNTSGYRGVSYNKWKGKYGARIMVNGVNVNLGDKSTAAEAYQLRVDYIKTHNLKGFEV